MIASFIVASIVLLIAWITIGSTVVEHREHIKDHNPFVQVLIYLFGFIFIVFIDIPYNIIFGTLYFQELPKAGRWTLTARLRHILYNAEIDSWQWSHAFFICSYLIEPWDAGHCGMHLGRK